MSNRVKISQQGGVTVKVTMDRRRYEVEIFLPKESIEKEMHIKNNQFDFRFQLTGRLNESITIKLQEEYKVDAYGMIQINNRSKLEFQQSNCRGRISLSPLFYISSKVRKKVKKSKQEYAFFAKHATQPYNNRPSPSKFTNYAKNNAGRPYGGGLVTPK